MTHESLCLHARSRAQQEVPDIIRDWRSQLAAHVLWLREAHLTRLRIRHHTRLS